MMPNLLKILLVLPFVTWSASTDSISYFTSVKKLRELAAIDVQLFSRLNHIVLDGGDDIFREKISHWSDEVVKIKNDIEKYVGNPLNAFKLIRRNFIDLASYEKFIPGLRKHLRNNNTVLPTRNDLVGATSGLARLQKFYMLRTHEFANGIINGIATDTKLTPIEMITVSNQLRGLGFWENKLAREYHEFSKNSSFQTTTDIFDESFVKTGTFAEEKEQILMQKMCRGEIRKTSAEQSKLYCFYRSTNPFTMLAKFKVEVVNIEPMVYIGVDILSDEEIEEILKIQHESKTTKDSTVGRAQGQTLDLKMRVSGVDRFHEDEHNIFKRIGRRMDVRYLRMQKRSFSSYHLNI